MMKLYQLEQKLAETIWWLLELSQRLDEYLAEMETFLLIRRST